MKKNVEIQGGGIKCDNPNCDYIKEDVNISEYELWLNKPCPKCGENLLTKEDYDKVQLMLMIVEMANNMDYVSDPDEPKATMSVDIHNEKIEITDIEEPYAKKKTKGSRRKKDQKGD